VNVALAGLPLSGKTCLFDALCQGAVDSAANPARADHPNAATVAVPDPRLDWLTGHYQAKKRTPVQIEWLDLPGLAPGRNDLASQNTAIMEHFRRADVLVAVMRAFDSPRVPGKADPRADRAALHAEFVLADLETTLRRIEKLEKQLTKPVAEREAMKRELDFLARCREALEAERPLHEVVHSDAERAILRGFSSLTEKPVITVLNVGEGQAGRPAETAAAYADFGRPLVALCASLEAEIAKLPPADRPAFMAELGLDGLHSPEVIHGVCQALNRITFYTVGEKEAAARSVVRGATAVQAAGEVHTDMARGFVRAEVVGFEELHRAGSQKQARAEGHVRMEGRDYVVRDGDVILFHFSR
jgi:hypothetical protein